MTICLLSARNVKTNFDSAIEGRKRDIQPEFVVVVAHTLFSLLYYFGYLRKYRDGFFYSYMTGVL